jgi:hypothetical protein
MSMVVGYHFEFKIVIVEGVPGEGARAIEDDCDDLIYRDIESSGRTEC